MVNKKRKKRVQHILNMQRSIIRFVMERTLSKNY